MKAYNGGVSRLRAAAVVVLLLAAGCGGVQTRVSAGSASGPWDPPLPNPAPAYHIVGTDVFVCWNPYGSPLPQPGATCPPSWGGRPPENPAPRPTPTPTTS